MSMISSLDALEADTNATSAPRAAVFQPKVKPRARKAGGGGGDSKSVPAKPPPTTAPREKAAREKAAVAPADPSPPAAAERFITESDDLSKDEESRVQDARPPVAIRSNFPVPLPVTRSLPSDEDVGLARRSSPERDGEARLANEPSSPQEAEKYDTPNSQNPNFAPSPMPSTSGHADRKKQEVEKSGPPSIDEGQEEEGVKQQAGVEEEEARQEAGEEEEEEGGEQQAATEDDGGEQHAVADEVEPVSEVPTSKRGRKRKFPHSTSQPRMHRSERDGVAVKIDFSKTDLSDPGKLTMREIIRRAEAIERKKLKAEVNKKSAENDGKQKQAAVLEEPERDAVSMAPQVQVINGRIVINEESLTVGAYATSRLNTEAYTRVEENAPRLNYNSYRDKAPTERWKADDTDVFYLALKQFGTDFELIQNLFPGRTRRQVKAKFKKEERNNPRRLQEALAHRPNDQTHYTDMINRLKADESGPTADDPLDNIIANFNSTV